AHLDRALDEAEHHGRDVVVLTVRLERAVGTDHRVPNFSPDEQELFTAVVNRAEHHGRTVVPPVVASHARFFATARTAQTLQASEVALGRSAKFEPDFQAESFALRWGAVEPDASRDLRVRVVEEGRELSFDV